MRFLIIFMVLAFACPLYASYDASDRYVREAEYYQKKADSYRREASYYLKKAEIYLREAAYYTKRGKIDTAMVYQRKAKRAMGRYATQLKYAASADEKAAAYLKRASNALKSQQ